MSSAQLSSYSGFAGSVCDPRGTLVSNAVKVPTPPRQPSSAQDDELTTQPSTASSTGAAASLPAAITASHAAEDSPVRTITQPSLETRSYRGTASTDRRRSYKIAATTSDEASHPIAEFLLPPDLQDPILSARRYRIVNELGKGTLGKVFLAWDERRQHLVAIKTQHKRREACLSTKCLRHEIAALKELHHENLVEWFHTIETATDVYVVLEFCGGGTLLDYIKEKKDLCEEEVKWMFVQILSALFYMHSKTYCHRDLKCENVLISNTNPNLTVKLTDFGFARCPYDPYRGTSCRRTLRIFSIAFCGTMIYASPELLSNMPYNSLVNDLWSLGALLYEMLFARTLFQNLSRNQILRNQQNGQHLQHLLEMSLLTGQSGSQAALACDLIIGMLQFNVEERFVMRDVMLHNWTAREFARYETQRLGLPGGSFRLPPEELTVLPYRLNLRKSNDLCYYHNMHHISKKQYTTASVKQVHNIVKTNPETIEGIFRTGDSKLELRVILRSSRVRFNWSEIFKNTPEFKAKDAVLEALTVLSYVQNFSVINRNPAVQDAMSLLQAVLLFSNSSYCTNDRWDEIYQEACVKLHFAIQSLHTMHEQRRLMSEQQNEEAEIPGIESTLRTQLYKLDEEAELRSSGFVERNLLKYCNATGHSGFIITSGELLEWAPDGKLITFTQVGDKCNRMKLPQKPAQSYDDVRTLVDDLLDRTLYEDGGATVALVRAGLSLLKIRLFLREHPEDETYPNISYECTQRLRKLAEIEANSQDAFLKFLKPFLK